jgi:formylglycine-generating enzyme required for sulfatase activity
LGKFVIPKDKKTLIITVTSIVIAIIVLSLFFTCNTTKFSTANNIKQLISKVIETFTAAKGTAGSSKQSGSSKTQSADNQDPSSIADELAQLEQLINIIEQQASQQGGGIALAELLVLLQQQGGSAALAELLALQQQGGGAALAELLALQKQGGGTALAELVVLLQQQGGGADFAELLVLLQQQGGNAALAELAALLQQPGGGAVLAELLALQQQGNGTALAELVALLQQPGGGAALAELLASPQQGGGVALAELVTLLQQPGGGAALAELLSSQQQGSGVPLTELLVLLQQPGGGATLAELLVLQQQEGGVPLTELLTLLQQQGDDVALAELLTLLQQHGGSAALDEWLALQQQGENVTLANWLAQQQEKKQQNEAELISQIEFQNARRPIPVQPAPPPVRRMISANMVLMSSGSFEMDIIIDEENPESNIEFHHVTVNSFYIAKYEVTQREYQNVMGNNPSYFKGQNLPVENVSWFDAIEYCNALSKREGLTLAYTITGSGNDRVVTWNKNANGYRLPTEEEWVYACRANTTTPYNTGDSISRNMSNYFGRRTVNVGSYQPNSWGLYDMHGNVSEWCWNLFISTSSENITRIIRGGSWLNTSMRLRSSFRDHYFPQLHTMTIGFRIAQNYLDS